MHWSVNRREKAAGATVTRRHLWADLPDNPICWAIGHKARVRIIEPRTIDPWLLIDCRVCGRRYRNPDAVAHDATLTRDQRRDAAERRLDIARQRPHDVAASASGRVGYDQVTLELGVEIVRRPTRGGAWRRWTPGFKLHLGNTGSETPLDGFVDLGPVAAHWSIGGVGGRLAETLGRGHKRDLSLRIHAGSLWWKVWFDDDGGYDDHHRCDKRRRPRVWPWSAGRGKYRSWMCLRDGNIDLNPLDALWGHRFYNYENLAPATVVVNVGADETDRYLVDLTLQRQTRARREGPAWARGNPDPTLVVAWRSQNTDGIPFRNHSWKGDGSHAGTVGLPDDVTLDEWITAARAALIASTTRDRARYNYIPPKAVQL